MDFKNKYNLNFSYVKSIKTLWPESGIELNINFVSTIDRHSNFIICYQNYFSAITEMSRIPSECWCVDTQLSADAPSQHWGAVTSHFKFSIPLLLQRPLFFILVAVLPTSSYRNFTKQCMPNMFLWGRIFKVTRQHTLDKRQTKRL